jgi:hypothetical protein
MIDFFYRPVLKGIADENVAWGSVLPSSHNNCSMTRW